MDDSRASLPMAPRTTAAPCWAARLRFIAPAILVCALCACGPRNRSVSLLPPGLVENETKRLVRAQAIASEAYQSSDRQDAMRLYTDAVRLYRELPVAWNNLGVLLMAEDRFVEASSAFATASDLAPSDPRPVYNRGLLLTRRGYLREAREYYSSALERDPHYLPALRAAVKTDAYLSQGSLETLHWVEAALMLEQNEKWQKWLKLQKIRIENLPSVKVQTKT